MKLSQHVISIVKELKGDALKKALATGHYQHVVTEPVDAPREPGQDDQPDDFPSISP